MVTIQFERNESHPQGQAHAELGPFEWIQVTYNTLRISPDGQEIAVYVDGYWILKLGREGSWTDFIVG